MDREKLIKQLFVGKVAEIIGTEKTTELLKEATVAIDEMLKSRKPDFVERSEQLVCDECTDGSGWYGDEEITYNCSKCNPKAN